MGKSKGTILVVEDNPADRIVRADYLRASGYEVIGVRGPAEAKQCLMDRRDSIDAVVLDLVMPQDNPRGGEDVLRFMDEEGLRVPVILATAWGYSAPARRAKEAYPELVRAVLTKPFDLQRLISELGDAMSK